MKKYESPEFKVLSINVKNVMLGGSDENPVPGLDPVDAVKDFGFAEDIESDLFGNESFGTAEEW